MYKIVRAFNIVALSAIIIFCGCSSAGDAEYFASIQNGHQLRIDSLKGETGFLNLAGLYWLEEGKNTFGTDPTNLIEFPSIGTSFMGSFLLQDSLVYLIPAAPIKIKGKVLGDTTLVFGKGGNPPIMAYKSLHWFVIKRGKCLFRNKVYRIG